MVVKVGINGFGRIRTSCFRRIQNVEGVEVTHLTTLESVMLTLVEIDATQGRFDGTVEVKEVDSEVNGKFVQVSAGVIQNKSTGLTRQTEIVLEATGFFATKAAAEKTLACWWC